MAVLPAALQVAVTSSAVTLLAAAVLLAAVAQLVAAEFAAVVVPADAPRHSASRCAALQIVR
jgi:hypothetical protein